mmetsp:Transcript_118509/g.335208  ORF Transcript_118509/g.335208 Transcript_118509/m.335208 type:complete len:219 (+) Transcript_118509:1098-1754(+)
MLRHLPRERGLRRRAMEANHHVLAEWNHVGLLHLHHVPHQPRPCLIRRPVLKAELRLQVCVAHQAVRVQGPLHSIPVIVLEELRHVAYEYGVIEIHGLPGLNHLAKLLRGDFLDRGLLDPQFRHRLDLVLAGRELLRRLLRLLRDDLCDLKHLLHLAKRVVEESDHVACEFFLLSCVDQLGEGIVGFLLVVRLFDRQSRRQLDGLLRGALPWRCREQK